MPTEREGITIYTLEELVGEKDSVIIKIQNGVEIRLEKTPDGTIVSYPMGNEIKKTYGGSLVKTRNKQEKDRLEVFQELQKIIERIVCCDISEITPDTTLEDLGADSLDQVEIVMLIESSFNITVPDREAEKLVREKLEKNVD
jgi:acyl carrier protein